MTKEMRIDDQCTCVRAAQRWGPLCPSGWPCVFVCSHRKTLWMGWASNILRAWVGGCGKAGWQFICPDVLLLQLQCSTALAMPGQITTASNCVNNLSTAQVGGVTRVSCPSCSQSHVTQYYDHSCDEKLLESHL